MSHKFHKRPTSSLWHWRCSSSPWVFKCLILWRQMHSHRESWPRVLTPPWLWGNALPKKQKLIEVERLDGWRKQLERKILFKVLKLNYARRWSKVFKMFMGNGFEFRVLCPSNCQSEVKGQKDTLGHACVNSEGGYPCLHHEEITQKLHWQKEREI